MPEVVDQPDEPEEPDDPGRRKVVRDSLGVGLAVGASGLTFGAAGSAAGLSVLQCCAMSLLVFTGASQFALLGVLGGGGSALAGAASALALGIRNTFYGIRLASLLGLSGLTRVLSAQLVTDESTAMAVAQAPAGAEAGSSVEAGAVPARGVRRSRLAFFTTGVTLYLLWNLTTLVGAVAAQAVGNPESFGIDVAVPAAFLALVAPRLQGPVERRTAVLAVAIALVAVPLTPVGVPVLLAALAVLPVLRARRQS